MKRTVALLLILVLCLSSCKVADEETAYIDETIAATRTKEKETEQVEEKSEQTITDTDVQTNQSDDIPTPETQTEEKASTDVLATDVEQTTDAADQTNPTSQNNDGTVPTPEEGDKYYNEYFAFKSGDRPLHSDVIYANYPLYSKGSMQVHIEYNGNMYYRDNVLTQFPEGTVYEDVDLLNLKPTGETVTVQYYDEYDHIEQTATGEIYELPKQMQNDPYVNMLAVRVKGYDCSIFYSENENYVPSGKVINVFEANNRLHRSECLSAETVRLIRITVDGEDWDYVELIAEMSKIYNAIIEFPVTDVVPEEETAMALEFQFLDYTGEHFDFYPQSNILKCGDGFYQATEEFEQLLLSYLS